MTESTRAPVDVAVVGAVSGSRAARPLDYAERV